MEGVAAKKALLDRYNEIASNYSDETADEMAKLQDEIDSKNLWDLDSQVDLAMDALRCPPDDADVDQALRRRAPPRRALPAAARPARAAAARRADQPSRRRKRELAGRPSAQLSGRDPDRHPRPLLPRQCHRLDSRARPRPRHSLRGQLHLLAPQKQKRLEQESREDEARQRTLQRESEWISSSPKARQAKSKARYQRYEDLLKIANAKVNTVAQITIPVAERLGQNVVDFDHLTKGFGDNLLIDDLTFKLPPGGIVGVIGPNGAGKTTLFRMITGQEKPDKGTIKIGESVRLGYVDQSRDSLDGKKTVWEEISEGNDMILLGKKEMNSRAYCASFNFKGADQQKKVGSLSGGERNRVHLAKMLRSGANLLLLDEPTNDLDVDTLRALEEALEDFAGCAVIISHDRWFLDRIATHILSFEGDSHVEWFEGNFQDYEQDKMRRLGTDSVIPHRLKYKKFSR